MADRAERHQERERLGDVSASRDRSESVLSLEAHLGIVRSEQINQPNAELKVGHLTYAIIPRPSGQSNTNHYVRGTKSGDSEID